MTVKNPREISDIAFYSALAEQVYRRHPSDQSLTDKDIFGSLVDNVTLGPQSAYVDIGAAVKLKADGTTGYFYSQDFDANGNLIDESAGNGFVARVVKIGTQYTIAYRGTDLSGDFSEIARDQVGYKNSDGVDSGDFFVNRNAGGGTFERTQVDDALALYHKIKALAADDNNASVVVTGQSLGGGLAGLVGAITGAEAHIISPAPFKRQLENEAFKNSAKKILEDFGDQFSDDFKELHVGSQIEFLATIVDQAANLSSQFFQYAPALGGNDALIHQIASNFVSEKATLWTLYLSRIPNLDIHLNEGEALTSGIISSIISPFSDHFDIDSADKKYKFGVGDDVGANASVSLHHPSMHALSILTYVLRITVVLR